MGNNKKVVILITFMLVFSFNFILAEDFGYNYLESGKNLNPAIPTFNNDTGSVNNSAYWMGMGSINTTQMEDNSGVLNILESWLETLPFWCKLTGCTMTGNLTFSNAGINNADYIKFNTAPPTITHEEGTCHWDDNAKTLECDMNVEDVHLQVGQENYILGKNTPVENCKVVYKSMTQGNFPVFTMADATTEATSSKTIGVTTNNCSDSTFCYVTTFGRVGGCDTSAFNENDTLWLSTTPGEFMANVPPSSPNHATFVGFVKRVHATEGEIYVKIQNGFEFWELHDVNNSLMSPTNKTLTFWNDDSKVWSETSNLFYDFVNGFVGINTSTPQATLDVNGNSIFDGIVNISGDLNVGVSPIVSELNLYGIATFDGDGFSDVLTLKSNQNVNLILDSTNFADGHWAIGTGASETAFGTSGIHFTHAVTGNTPLTMDSDGSSFFDGNLLVSDVFQVDVSNEGFNVNSNGVSGTRGFNLNQGGNTLAGALGTFSKSRGTIDTPLAIGGIDFIGTFVGKAYDGTSFLTTSGITFRVNGAVSTGVVPTEISFITGSNHNPSLNGRQFTIKQFEIVVNDDSQMIDFRVESDNLDPAFIVQGSNGNVGINTPIPTTELDVNGTITSLNLNVTGISYFENLNITGNLSIGGVIKQDGYTIESKPSNELINGDTFTLNSNATTPMSIPYVGLQQGGPGQASWIGGSFMLVNRNATILNTVNATDCKAQADSHGIELKIDCNSTSPGNPLGTGPDILLFGDQQISGEVHIRDSSGEWKFLTRLLDSNDELTKDTLFNDATLSISGSNLILNDTSGQTLIINLDKNVTIKTFANDSIALNLGTDISPQFNHVSYQNITNPTLKIDNAEVPDSTSHADISIAILGASANNPYLFDDTISTSSRVLDKIYDRFESDGATYLSGLIPDANSTTLNISNGEVKIRISTKIYNNNVSSTDDFYIINSSNNYITSSGNSIFTKYSDGTDIGNNRYFTVIWGVVPSLDSTMRLVAVIQDAPTQEYVSVSDAEADKENKILFFPRHTNIKWSFVPVAKTIIKKTGNNDFQQLSSGLFYQNIVGQVTTSGGSAPSPPITQHNLFTNLEWANSNHTFDLTGQIFNISSYNFWTSSNATIVDTIFTNFLGRVNNFIGNLFVTNATIVNLNVTGEIINDAIYIEASDSVDQEYGTAGVPQIINLTTFDEGNGITLATGNGTNITISVSGVYHIVAQPQVTAGAGGAGVFHMWLQRDTGSGFVDIDDSNIELSLASNEEDVIVLSTTLKLNEGNKLRLASSVSDTKIKLDAIFPAGEPTIPSIIFTMFKVGS